MNTNCLKGMKCPKCGQDEMFKIVATSVFTVTDEGTEDYSEVEWDDSNYCTCPACGEAGNVSNFKNVKPRHKRLLPNGATGIKK